MSISQLTDDRFAAFKPAIENGDRNEQIFSQQGRFRTWAAEVDVHSIHKRINESSNQGKTVTDTLDMILKILQNAPWTDTTPPEIDPEIAELFAAKIAADRAKSNCEHAVEGLDAMVTILMRLSDALCHPGPLSRVDCKPQAGEAFEGSST